MARFDPPSIGRSALPFPLALLLAGCVGPTAGSEEGEQAAAAPVFPPAVVAVAEVDERAVSGEVRLVGTAGPWRRSTVASEVAGIVGELAVDEGDAVAEGQILARLRTEILQRVLERMEATLQADEAAYQLTVSRRRRIEALLDDRVISQQEFDDSRHTEEEAQHRVASDRAEVLRLRDLIGKTTIRAPFAGTVVRKRTEVGEWVGEGGAIVEMVDQSRMEIRIALPERYLVQVSGEGIRVSCDAVPGFEWEAVLRSIAPDGDPATRTFPMRLEVPNRDGRLRGGMLCRSQLPLEHSRRALFVPKDAVVDDGRERVVFTVDGDVARRTPVRRGAADGDRVEVEGDLETGQMVVVRGNERLQDGQAVRILDETDGDSGDAAGEEM